MVDHRYLKFQVIIIFFDNKQYCLTLIFLGAEFGITSDGFFELEQLPPRVAVIGAGYIAVELAGILQVKKIKK